MNPDLDAAAALPEWTTAVARELGLENAVGDGALTPRSRSPARSITFYSLR
jgi:hypothetical protein